MKILAKTDIGKAREINQDCYYRPSSAEELNLFIIADGMGGYNGGEVASNLAVLTTKKYIEENMTCELTDEQVTKVLTNAVLEAHKTICNQAHENEELEEMGTTLDICLIYNKKLYIAHLGDSRVYRITKRKIEQITVDHSYVEKLVKEGSITRNEAFNHPKKNMLMKALGGDTDATPDIYIERFNENDIILMCTDGLTNMLRDEEIFAVINTDKDLADVNLITEANLKGGLDNITVVLIEKL